MTGRWMVMGLGVMMIGGAGTAMAQPTASFNCARATTADARAICASPALRRLDGQMGWYYHAIAGCVGMGVRGDLIDWQNAWLAKRAGCGANRSCLTRMMRDRVALLRPYALPARASAAQGDCPNGRYVPPGVGR